MHRRVSTGIHLAASGAIWPQLGCEAELEVYRIITQSVIMGVPNEKISPGVRSTGHSQGCHGPQAGPLVQGSMGHCTGSAEQHSGRPSSKTSGFHRRSPTLR